MDVKYGRKERRERRDGGGFPLHRLCALCVLCVLCSSPSFVSAVDTQGVRPGALDQPRVNIPLRRAPTGPPLSTGGKREEKTINVEAFLDTGASGIMLSTTTADALGVK